MQYNTFDLVITPLDAPEEYELRASSPTQGEGQERTRIDRRAEPLAGLLAQFEDKTVSRVALQSLGHALYQRLIFGEIGEVFHSTLGETDDKPELGVRLRLHLPAPLAVLPWEFLCTKDGKFLATSSETPISRYLDLTQPPKPLACPPQIRILAVIPKNSGLEVSAERRLLKKISAKLPGHIMVDFLEGAATSAAIRQALAKNSYHIFHYAGHGLFQTKETAEAFIYLDDEIELTRAMSAPDFADFFLDYPSLRLVVLNACQGATRSACQALAGAAPQLVLAGVPAVVAMQYTIANDDAVLFATEFYSRLCDERNGGQAEVALAMARKALKQDGADKFAFGNPVLYLRSDDGRLWEPAPPRAVVLPPQIQPTLPANGGAGQSVSAKKSLIIDAVLLVLVFFLAFFSHSSPRKISLAMADFENATADSTLTATLINDLAAELEKCESINLFTKAEMDTLCREIGKPAVDLETAFAIGRQLKIHAVLSGKIINPGEMFRVEVNIYDVATRDLLVSKTIFDDDLGKIWSKQSALSQEIKKRVEKVAHDEHKLYHIGAPSFAACRFYLRGQKYYLSGQTSEALASLEQTVALDSGFVEAWRALAVCHDAAGNSADAIRCAQRACALTSASDERELLQSRLIEAQVRHDWDKSLEYLKAYLQLQPDDVKKRLQLGFLLSRGKKSFREAIAEFEKVVALAPADLPGGLGPTYNYLGHAYLFAGEIEKAMAAFKKYQALAADNPDPIHSLAFALSFQGEYKAALEQYGEVIATYPEYYKAYEDRGLTYLAVGKCRKARDDFRRYLQTAPASSRPRGHFLLGQLYLTQQHYALAAAEANNALQLDSLYMKAHWLAGTAWLADKKFDQAQTELQIMQKLLALPGTRDDVAYYHHLRGQMLLAKNDTLGLIELQNAVDTSPRDFIFFQKELAAGYLKAGRAGAAIKEAWKLVELNRNFAEALYLLGIANEKLAPQKMEALEEAEAFFRQAHKVWQTADDDFYPLLQLQQKLRDLSLALGRGGEIVSND
jgi:tetratricopeptide (TPR) repeat protein